MIGIIGAMAIEVAPLLSELLDPQEDILSGRTFHRGIMRGHEAVVVQCGVGKVNAAMCTEALILTYRPSLVINVGVAGALTGALRVGDVAVAKDLVQYDVDTTAVGDPLGLVSTVNRIDFPCAEWAVKKIMCAAGEMDIRASVVRIASGDRFNDDPQTTRLITEYFHAEACEMEACPIGQVCLVNGVECAVIRGISDSTEGVHSDEYSQFNAFAAERAAGLLLSFLNLLGR